MHITFANMVHVSHQGPTGTSVRPHRTFRLHVQDPSAGRLDHEAAGRLSSSEALCLSLSEVLVVSNRRLAPTYTMAVAYTIACSTVRFHEAHGIRLATLEES